MQKIQAKGFVVHFDGDETAGVFPQQWTISGKFSFDSEEDFMAFKESICAAFEHCSDTPIWVETVEKQNEQVDFFT